MQQKLSISGGVIMKELVTATLVSMTCTWDKHDHWIRDTPLGGAGSSGRYRAVCGRLVIPAPLVAPPGKLCPACVAICDGSRVRHQREIPGALARLMRVFFRPPALLPGDRPHQRSPKPRLSRAARNDEEGTR